MTETVVATVMTADGQYCEDLELPAAIPADELLVELSRVLAETVTGLFSVSDHLGLYYMGERIPGDISLSSAGIWDGSVLTIRR